jgi:rhodanese-related sulfurtransferase
VGRATVADLLAGARERIAPRQRVDMPLPVGALLVDLRSDDERSRHGVIPGSLHVPRSVLEWRADPDSPWRNPLLAELDRPLVLVCAHGFSSSLAAATMRDLGFTRVTDLEGGFEAWRDAGLPVVAASDSTPALPGMGVPFPFP